MVAVASSRHALRRAILAVTSVGLAVFAASQLNDNTFWAVPLLIGSGFVAIQTLFAMLKHLGVPVTAIGSADSAAHRARSPQINPATGMFVGAGGLDGSGQAFGCRTDRH